MSNGARYSDDVLPPVLYNGQVYLEDVRLELPENTVDFPASVPGDRSRAPLYFRAVRERPRIAAARDFLFLWTVSSASNGNKIRVGPGGG